jgi:hypothetical protein
MSEALMKARLVDGKASSPIEVDGGVKYVILNPPVTLVDGSKVQLRP